jgi:hypothetical protein
MTINDQKQQWKTGKKRDISKMKTETIVILQNIVEIASSPLAGGSSQ